jgi:hypothetical protein
MGLAPPSWRGSDQGTTVNTASDSAGALDHRLDPDRPLPGGGLLVSVDVELSSVQVRGVFAYPRHGQPCPDSHVTGAFGEAETVRPVGEHMDRVRNAVGGQRPRNLTAVAGSRGR